MMALTWPWVLWLAPLPLLALLRRSDLGSDPATALWVPQFKRWASLAAETSRAKSHIRSGGFWLLFLTWLCLLLGLARPTWVGEPILLPQTGRDLLLAVDISGSMRVEDMVIANQQVRRIDAVRQIGADFIERREGDQWVLFCLEVALTCSHP